MFLGSDIIEFVNKIINSKEIKDEQIANNLKEFVNYLKLTKMADEQTLKCLNSILSCLPEIINLKNKIGYLDINIILGEKEKLNMDKSDEKQAKNKVKQYEQKHYNHYHKGTSDPCGVSSRVSSPCGVSSSSSDSCCSCVYSFI